MSDSGTVDIFSYIGIIYPFLLLLSIVIVIYYAEPDFPWHSYITCTIGYFSSFGILLLVPIDISAIVIARRSTSSVLSSGYDYYISHLSQAYSTFFTLVLILGSVVLVFEEYYNTDGYFTIGSKLCSALKRLLFDTILGAVAGVVILGILISKHIVGNNTAALQLAAVIVTNTVYESILMFLLGYGLVEFPRSLWQNSDLEGYLLKVQNKAACRFIDIRDAELNVSLVVSDVMKTKEQLSSYANATLSDAMSELLAECPSEFRSSRLGSVATNKSGQITIDSLALLRTRLNTLKDRYRQAQATSDSTKFLAYYLEDVINARIKASTEGIRSIHWTLLNKDSTEFEYTWHSIYRPLLMKFFSLFCFGLSILSFVGVVCSMNGVPSSSSPYFQAVHDKKASATGIVIFVFMSLGYTAYVTMWSLFQMKLEGYVALVPGRTTPESLSFNVRMCARLAAPLSFFYLGWIAENGLEDGYWTESSTATVVQLEYFNTTTSLYSNGTISNSTTVLLPTNVTISSPEIMLSAFSHFYQLQSVGVIRKTFGLIFPIMLYCVVGLILPNILNRILVLLRMPGLQFGAEIVTEEQLREGKRQLERNKQLTARMYQRSLLKNTLLRMGKSRDASDTDEDNGYFRNLFGTGKKSKPSALNRNSQEESGTILNEPDALSGQIEKKGTSSYGLGGAWVEFDASVQPPGLLLFKDRRTGSIESSVDLRQIVNFNSQPMKKGREAEFDLMLADSAIKLRFKSVSEMETWKSLLMEWKDYAIDYYELYPDGDNSNRQGSNAMLSDVAGARPLSVNSKAKAEVAGNVKKGGLVSKAELDDIVVEDGDNDDISSSKTARRGSGGLFASLGFGKGKNREDSQQESLAPVDDTPPMMEGWLEKKSHSRVQLGNEWQRRYVRIDPDTTSLNYYKNNSVNEKPTGSIDLRLAVDIGAYEAKGKRSADRSRFNIDMGAGDKVYKFRAASAVEGDRWIKGLNDWRDYFLLKSV